jgi:hypothetical protein
LSAEILLPRRVLPHVMLDFFTHLGQKVLAQEE